MPAEILLSLALVLFLVALSGFFSSAEAAFLSLERMRVTHLVSIGAPGAQRVAEMLSQPSRLLSTILLGNNVVNVAFTALITVIAVDLLGQGRGVAVATIAGTATLLLLGEIIPKTLAVTHAQPIAFFYSKPLRSLEVLSWPLVWALQVVTSFFATRLGFAAQATVSITEAELRTMLNVGEKEGTFAPEEVEMLEKAFRFRRRQARELMTPRPEIISIPSRATLGDFLTVYASCGHTRIPIQGENDDIIGLVSGKDVLLALSAQSVDPGMPILSLMRDVSFVPASKPVTALFEEMRRTGNQMDIVLDEHGAVIGLVTLKRIAEEVVGAVGEEGSAPEEEFQRIDEHTYWIEGGMNIHDANESLSLDLPDGPYDTIAGFVLETLKHFPEEREQFTFQTLQFEVERINRYKIELVKVTTVDSDPTAPESREDSMST
jgi:putative hemolysin